MTDLSSELGFRRNRHLGKAVYQNRALSRAGFSERLFALLFTGLVYPQIWEDPEVDIEAMELLEGHRVVTIASGGCNVLAYLTRSPAHIDAVDLNRAHIALNRLKLAAVKHLPAQADLFRFFGEAGNRDELRRLRPLPRAASRRRDPALLGEATAGADAGASQSSTAISTAPACSACSLRAGHKAARLYGVDPTSILKAHDLADQRRFFEEEIGPIFDRKLMRLVLSRKSSLFGLGIPPAQYDSLITSGDGSMASVLKARLEKLACDFPLNDNYFAWQAFARRYPSPGEGALPAYLDKANYETLKQNTGRVAVHHVNFTELLAKKPAGSVDRFVLLDAQDWMTDAQLNALWTEITRTAAPGARVIFRTAAEESLLPGRVSDALLGEWRYADEQSHNYSARDRSAIYGGFHLYVKAG